MWWSKTVLVMVAVLAYAPDASHAQSILLLKGRVVDIGKTESANGIEAVTVQVIAGTPNQTIGEGITDAAGYYEIKVAPPLVLDWGKLSA